MTDAGAFLVIVSIIASAVAIIVTGLILVCQPSQEERQRDIAKEVRRQLDVMRATGALHQ
ncbi:MAG TPA: hypothetical protein VFA59_17975 [Vicinamibacterales bacterium]|nr:hypothetical protein [Vicinamibacterales bacterium]